MKARSGSLPALALALACLLLPGLAISAAPAAASATVVAGVDYLEIPDAAPFAPSPGRVEVVEVFGYTCGHCANFEPQLRAWAARLPKDVQFTEVAAPFGGLWIPYAKAFYAAQSLDLADAAHEAMFRALHDERSLPITGPTPEQIAAFYARHGADEAEFIAAMSSPQVEAAMQSAQAFIRRSGVEGTPSLVVNGKYRVIGGKTHADLLRIADALIARERALLTSAPVAASAAENPTR